MNFSELRLLASYPFVSTQPVLVDVGAHHGSFSRTFAKQGWTVVAFEPETKNRVAFERNLSGYDNVTCIPKAVSNVTGEKVPFYVSEEHYGIHSLKPFHQTHRLAYEVETTRLDDILTQLAVEAATLLKVDIEGADFLALQGYDFSKGCPEIVMIEFMDERSQPNFGYTHHDVAAYMKTLGYTTFISEWAPIQEYGREGIPGQQHTWLQCVAYPLDHEPAWGNLIFVLDVQVEQFAQVLNTYLTKLERQAKRGARRARHARVHNKSQSRSDEINRELAKSWLAALRHRIKMIPGAQTLYNAWRDF